MLAFVAGDVDMTSPYFLQVPVLKDVKNQAPKAICELTPSNVNRNVMLNREAPPFNNPELQQAAALSVDRKAFVDILTEGKGNIGGAMLPPPEGVWGMPPDMLKTLPGYDPDVLKNRAEARKIMQKLGYGPDKRLAVTVSTQHPAIRDPAIILTTIEGDLHRRQLDPIDTAHRCEDHARSARSPSTHGNGLDDPDQTLYENLTCGAEGNYDGYCNPEVDKMVDRQSMESTRQRQGAGGAVERKLAEDRPAGSSTTAFGTCGSPTKVHPDGQQYL
jgi:peptide/nickel transport system substrate-binding protein